MMGEGNDIRLVHDKLWDKTLRTEGWNASENPQLVTLTHVGLTRPHLKSYGDEPGTPEVIEDNRKTLVKYFKGIKMCSSNKVTQPTDQLECLYTNTCSMGNKQEELEATMLLEDYDLEAITESWWDGSHEWSVVIDGYRLFRRERYLKISHTSGDGCVDNKEMLKAHEEDRRPHFPYVH
ncbi:hypothetical protein AV530_016604 [Patagioenas fasciata monilis]|uniref:Uncharacterized protein n=1 Tax=Patagioenas fasciata monilis TaxID=372326 RepID=A0A1V4J2V7_PATFA|nr:hypothetical protein AV530_016604 [Patagioenas fasciata monilis]